MDIHRQRISIAAIFTPNAFKQRNSFVVVSQFIGYDISACMARIEGTDSQKSQS
jgi:hypothetical protein